MEIVNRQRELIDREMLKKDLAKKADISTTSIAKLGKNER